MKNRFARSSVWVLASITSFAGLAAHTHAADEPAAAAPAAASLPDAKAIMEKYVEAIGGREKLQSVKSRIMSSTIEFPEQGMKGTSKVYQAPPAMVFSETEIAGIGKFTQGSDGAVAWESNAMMGTRVLSGKEKANFLRSMRFNAEYDFANTYKSMKTIDTGKVGDREAFIVELVSNDDVTEKRLFDKETGLLLSLQSKIPSQMGEIESETFFSDYRAIDGVKIPFKTIVKVMTSEISTTVDKAEFNAEIPADRFALPEDVKKLIEKQNAAPGPTATPADAPATPANEKK